MKENKLQESKLPIILVALALVALLFIPSTVLAAAPGLPTDVSATDGAHTDKVVITWTKSTNATKYEVFRDGVGLGELGDVATYDDTGANAPTITPGTANASDGTHGAYVALSLSGQSVANGTTHTYTVKAGNVDGWSNSSASDTGYRGHGDLTYQWQRSAADSDADYSNITGATTASYNDTDAPADGSGRYYKCVESAVGATQQTSSADRGYRATNPVITTLEADPVGKTTATLRTDLTSTGDATATVKFYWGDNDGVTTPANWDNVETLTEQTVGIISKAIAGLSTSTTYYYRAYAENVGGMSAWASSTVSFTTKAPGLATVVTEDATDIASTEATLKATLYDDGGKPCAIWIEYGPDQRCQFHTGYAIDKISGQSYTETVKGLLPGTAYYYMAVAYKPATEGVKGEISYGALKIFRTLGAGLAVPYSTTLPTVKVFKDVQQTNDRLIFARYDIDYEIDPTEPADAFYVFYLGNSNGEPLYTAKVISYGQGFVGLHLAPEHTFDWGSTDYTIVISARGDTTEGVNRATHALTSVDYEADHKEIKPVVDDIMWYVERDKKVTYLDNDGLNSAGMNYCKKALPGFESVYPYPYVPAFQERDYEEGYAGTLAGRWDGTTYGTAINNIADWAGLSPMWLTSIGWFALLVIVGFIVVTTTHSAKPALLLSIPMLIGGALLGFLPLVVTILTGFACILGIGYVFFYRSTA